MLRFVHRGFFLFLLLTVFLSSFCQRPLPNTLLWRISGNGLQTPSYLWGTLHLQDKRLFYFGDSLYAALQATDGYAMEINPQEFIDSLFNSSLQKEEAALLERQTVSLNRKKLSKSADSLLRNAGIKGSVATKKELKKLRDQRMAKFLQRGEMPTIMDAYLMGLARRLNKWTGGIEDVNDQLSLSDELGGELEPESVLAPQEAMDRGIEKMMQLYLAQNLAGIDSFSNGAYNETDRNALLLHRNVKMAFRMDSLSHTRSTFFTVGAAHLPGDSGVIALLKTRGFSVEPVFSSATRFAGDYAATLPPARWDTVTDANRTYTVTMPGPASEYNVLGSVIKMKMYFDMTTMTVYLTGAVTGPQAGPATLDDMLKGAAQNITGSNSPVKAKTVEVGTLSGKEALVENGEGSFRLRLLLQNKTVYMLMAGVMKKTAIGNPDVERFFASFVPGNAPADGRAWESFELPQKGFSVSMPGKPVRAEAIDKSLAQGNWQSASYNVVDASTGNYYLFQVREPADGFVVEGDSVFLETIKTGFIEKAGDVLWSGTGTYQGYPALFLNAYIKKADAVYKTMHVVRGNRVYNLISGFAKGADSSDAERFLRSLTLSPYESSALKTETADGFTSLLPSAIRQLAHDTTKKRSFYQATYSCSNPVDAAVYQVSKQTLSPTYWAKNDTAFFEGRLEQYKGYHDSVIRKEWVQNGSLRGIEAWIQSPGWIGWKRYRFLVNGDTLYTLYNVVARQNEADKVPDAFFTAFRLSNEVPPTIYTSKAKALLTALGSTDSTVRADATGNLSLVEFVRSDLPLLHAALLQPGRKPESYPSAGNKLAKIIGGLADPSTIDFIQKSYASLTGSKETLQYNLLTTLAHTKTAASYAALKELLLSHPPASGSASQLQYALLDSLPLTASLFPELLQHSNDSLLGFTVITVANRLLDSNRLARTALDHYESAIVEGAKRAERRSKNEGEGWTFLNWCKLLGQLNSSAGNAILRKALSTKELYLKQPVIVALLKNNQPVPTMEMMKVAADKDQRGEFYSELKKLGKESLFPALYASQKSLAESELQAYFSGEYGDFSLTYLTERTDMFNGKMSRFYLFRLRMAYDKDHKQNFLAVAGPYDTSAKEKLTTSDASGFYRNEELTATNLGKLFRLYLQQQTTVKNGQN